MQDPKPLLGDGLLIPGTPVTPPTMTPTSSFSESVPATGATTPGSDMQVGKCERAGGNRGALPGTLLEGAREVPRRSCLYVLKAVGPGIMVCLADTDKGSLLTAA